MKRARKAPLTMSKTIKFTHQELKSRTVLPSRLVCQKAFKNRKSYSRKDGDRQDGW